MLISAGYVPLIFHLECLHGAANVHVRRRLDRIANRHVANDGGRLAVIDDRSGSRYQMHNVQFVSHIFLNIHQEIVRMTKLQRYGLAALGSLMQRNQKQARGIRFHRLNLQAVDRGDLHSCNRPLFVYVGILHHRRALQHDEPVASPAEVEKTPGGDRGNNE